MLERCELRLWSDFSWRKLRTSALNVATICVSNISEPKQESQRLAVLPPYVGIFLNSCKSLQTFPASACGLQLVNALAKNFLCRLWSLVALYFLCLASQALEPCSTVLLVLASQALEPCCTLLLVLGFTGSGALLYSTSCAEPHRLWSLTVLYLHLASEAPGDGGLAKKLKKLQAVLKWGAKRSSSKGWLTCSN